MGNARRSSSAAPSRQERCFMNSITTRVWIAGASGRLGSALSHRFGGNTAYKLVTSDRDVPVEDVSVVGRFADINHPDVIINLCRPDRRAGLTRRTPKKRIRSTPSAPAIWQPLQDASTQNSFRSRPTTYRRRRAKAFCEFDDPHPTTMYGKSKYAGEKLVRELNRQACYRAFVVAVRVGSYDLLTACSIRRQRKRGPSAGG